VPKSQPTHGLQIKKEHCEMSIYNGELTKRKIVDASSRIMAAFPKLEKEWHDIFYEMVIEEGMSDDRLIAAVNNVIKTIIYPEPTIANFLNYDKKIKLYTYDQKLKLINEVGANVANKLYLSVKIEGMTKPMWAHVSDIEKYELQRFDADKQK